MQYGNRWRIHEEQRVGPLFWIRSDVRFGLNPMTNKLISALGHYNKSRSKTIKACTRAYGLALRYCSKASEVVIPSRPGWRVSNIPSDPLVV